MLFRSGENVRTDVADVMVDDDLTPKKNVERQDVVDASMTDDD